MTKEDKIQIALGLKFFCYHCKKVREITYKSFDATYYGEAVCINCTHDHFIIEGFLLYTRLLIISSLFNFIYYLFY